MPEIATLGTDLPPASRLRRKRAVILAVAACAVACALSCIVPRLWCSRPRFYADAYADATALLKQEFGDAAVSRGVISIPKDAIVVPWRAEAATYSALIDASAFVSVNSRSYLVRHLRNKAVECARVPRQDARRAYAVLAYIDRVRTDGGDALVAALGDGLYFNVGGSELSDRSWPWLNAKRVVQLPPSEPFSMRLEPVNPMLSTSNAPKQISELVCDMARARFIESLDASREGAFSQGGKVAFAALDAVMRPAVPPLNKWDRLRLESLENDYLASGGRKALPLLKTICAGPPYPWYTFLARVPVFRSILKFQRPEHRFWPVSSDIYGGIWALEQVDGRSDAEQMSLLAAAAFPNSHQAIVSARSGPEGLGRMRKARALLQQRFPDKWRALLVEKYAALPDANYPLISWDDKEYFLIPANPVPGDETVLQLLAADTSTVARMRAYAQLHALTHAAACIRALEDAVMSSLNHDPHAACAAIDALAGVYKRDPAAFDMLAFARTVLASITGGRENEGQGVSVVNGIEAIAGAEFVPLLSDVLCDPDRVFSPLCGKDTRHYIQQRAALALAHAPGDVAFKTLTGYVVRDYPDSDLPVTYDAVSALAMRGDPRAIPALRVVAARGANKPAFPYDSDAPAHARRAMISIGVKNAPSPSEAFAVLPPEDRAIFACRELPYFLSKSDLMTLLADDRTRPNRAAILATLARTRAQ